MFSRGTKRLLAGFPIAFLLTELLWWVEITPGRHEIFGLWLTFTSVAFLSSWLMTFALSRRVQLTSFIAGLALGGALFAWLQKPLWQSVAMGLGLAAIGVVAVQLWRCPPEERRDTAEVLLATLMYPAFISLSQTFLLLTTSVHPTTYDVFVALVDFGFGGNPSELGRALVEAVPGLKWLCNVVYLGLPVSLAIVWVALRRAKEDAEPLITGFALLGLFGYLCYLAFPVVGPQVLTPDVLARLTQEGFTPGLFDARTLAPRNCMPSLHTAWALWLLLQARRTHVAVRVFAVFQLVVTLLATVGLGYHYLIDLVVAVPFTVFVRALINRSNGELRRLALLTTAALTLGWLLGIRFAAPLLGAAVVGTWGLSLLTVVLSLRLDARLAAAPAAPEEAPSAAPQLLGRAPLVLAGVFFVSGFAGLCYEVVFSKSLALAFGSTNRASTLVLAIYMGGMALGVWLGGRWARRVESPLKAYAIAELAIAAWCGLTPWTMQLLKAGYVALARGAIPSELSLVPTQALFAIILLVPPTLAMGATTPLLARFLTDGDETLGRAAGWLYAANTLGAASGAVLTGYLLLPALGVTQSVLLAVALNLIAAVLALRLAGRPVASAGGVEKAVLADASPALRKAGIYAVGVLTVGGAITMALETTYIHLLAVVAGNSAFAFSLMVFCFLVGLSSGSIVGRKLVTNAVSLPTLLGLLQLTLAVVLFLGLGLWGSIPGYFGSFAGWPLARTFASREFIRFAVCALAMVPPAVVIGAAYPVAMELVGRAWPRRGVEALGMASALNTLGNVAGAALGGLWLVDTLGSFGAIRLLGLLAASLGVAAILASADRQRGWLGAGVVAAAVAVWVGPSSFDYDALSAGTNVYFQSQSYGRVIDAVESVEGGLTSVAVSQTKQGEPVLTMLTNGKFQGDNGKSRQMIDQLSISVFPLLHTPGRDRALVIGLGTGVSTLVAWEAGFAQVEVAELSRDIVDVAGRYFVDVNRGVLEKPNVQVRIADGRNLLQLSNEPYDFIGLEISSIWFAGAANLYNADFYRLVEKALKPQGVLQQWVQLHRLSQRDLSVIIASLREVFPYVWLYKGGVQGILVACQWDCEPHEARFGALRSEPKLKETLAFFGGEPASLLQNQILKPREIDLLVEQAKQTFPEPHVSTDDNLFLEYHTPRGNVRPFAPSLRENLQWLSTMKLGGPLRSEGSEEPPSPNPP